MGRKRRCDDRCHNAKGYRCVCWCGGAFHGAAGAANRQALKEGILDLTGQPGFKKGETGYMEQTKLVKGM